MSFLSHPRRATSFLLFAVILFFILDATVLHNKGKNDPARAYDLTLQTPENGEYRSAVRILKKTPVAVIAAADMHSKHPDDVAKRMETLKPDAGEAAAPLPKLAQKLLPKALKLPDMPKNYKAPDVKGGPKVVIIIDDMGMSRKNSMAMVNIKAPLTLAFLPYAPDLKPITAKARKNGHELMIHMPMEPLSKTKDPGPIALLDNMDEEAVRANLEKAFNSFEGYTGVNNHMGSRVTQNNKIMNQVMVELRKRDLFFVDSKTISTSVAADIAALHSVDYAERDVFLDHENNIEFVRGALRQLEITARRKGIAIAIGHPKDVTLRGLKEWLPTLHDKGIEVVPVSAALNKVIEQPQLIRASFVAP